MKKELAFALLPVVLLIGVSSGQSAKPCPPDNYQNVNATYDDVRKTTNFGYDLFREIDVQVPRKNIFFSPYSVWSALAIAYFGAEGNTLAQLQNVLRLGNKDKGYKIQRLLSAELKKNTGVQLEEVNRAFLDFSLALEECFQRVDFFDVQQADFSDSVGMAQKVNGLVNRVTRGLIKQVVTPDLLKRATFILLNAIYFKGTWEKQFDKTLTKTEDFFCEPGVPCGKVNMMERRLSQVNYVNNTNLGADVIELPYMNSSMSMLLFLPWENVNDVKGVISRLNHRAVAATVGELTPTKLELEVPKFKMEETLTSEMLEALGQLGITDLFSSRADLSAFTRTAALNADTIIHKAVVDVNEEGTEAAAVTVILPVRFGGFIPPLRITFNRPFVFLIVDKSLGLSLFNGVYRIPA